MKHTLLVLALLASFGASAQDSTSTSGSNSGSNSTSQTNAVAVGNSNDATAQSASRSESGAVAGSQSGALGNVVILDQSGPSSQTINANSTANVNEHYTGRVENVQSGTTTNINEVHYSGKQTVKNVPGIAMSGPASGPCTGSSGGVGLAGPGWGLGLNGAKVEPTCVVRENVRVIGMAMQSLDGGAHPQEKGELMILMMDAVRGLGAMNAAIIGEHVKAPK